MRIKVLTCLLGGNVPPQDGFRNFYTTEIAKSHWLKQRRRFCEEVAKNRFLSSLVEIGPLWRLLICEMLRASPLRECMLRKSLILALAPPNSLLKEEAQKRVFSRLRRESRIPSWKKIVSGAALFAKILTKQATNFLIIPEFELSLAQWWAQRLSPTTFLFT